MEGRMAHRYALDGTYIDSFGSLSEAKATTGASIAKLSLMLNRVAGVLSVNGYMWSEDKVDSLPPYESRKNKEKSFKIYQYSLSGKYIREFNSYKEISEELNISLAQASRVKNCIDGKAKSVSGYQWRSTKRRNVGFKPMNKI